jgi:hypothetical protein
MDCSNGQEGGPLMTKEGRLIGIYSNVEQFKNDDFYMVSVITPKFMVWFESQFKSVQYKEPLRTQNQQDT